MSLEKVDEAIGLFKKAKELEPGCIETYLNLGKIYIYKKEYLNAFETLSYAAFLDKEHNNKEVIFYQANSLYFMGDYTEALKKALFYIKTYGPDAECYYLMGLSYYRIEDYINSALYFSKAISLNSGNVNYLIYLGNSLKKLKMFEDARVSFLYALELDKNNIKAQAGYAALELESSIGNTGET